MFPHASSLLLLLLSSSVCFLFLSSFALDTAVYSSRDRDASLAAAAAAREAAAGGVATTPLPTTTPLPPLLLSSSSSSSAPLPVLLGRYDPCSEPGPATKGRALYLGLALWPGATPEAWGPSSSLSHSSKKKSSGTGKENDFDETSLHPCRLSARSEPQTGNPLPSAAATLAAAGVLIAPFAVRIDSVAAMRVSGDLQRRALELATAAAAARGGDEGGGSFSNSSSPSPVVSAVLFRGTKIRSEARIVSSADPGVSFGTGFVQALAAEVFFGKRKKKRSTEVDKS